MSESEAETMRRDLFDGNVAGCSVCVTRVTG